MADGVRVLVVRWGRLGFMDRGEKRWAADPTCGQGGSTLEASSHAAEAGARREGTVSACGDCACGQTGGGGSAKATERYVQRFRWWLAVQRFYGPEVFVQLVDYADMTYKCASCGRARHTHRQCEEARPKAQTRPADGGGRRR